MRRAAVLCLVLGVPSLASADAFHVIETHETVVNDLRRITTTVQSGDSPINRFSVERVLSAGQAPESLRPIILAPGLGQGQKAYTLGVGGGDFENSIAASLARGGADVFLYSSRQALLAPGSCRSGTDCSEAKKWGIMARVRDFDFIRSQIAAEHGSVKPVVGGVSLGAGTAIAAVNQQPNAYAGMVLVEFTIAPYSDLTVRASYQRLCDSYRAQLAAGQVFDNDFVQQVSLLSMLNSADPDGQSPFFPPGFTNRQAFLLAFGSPQPGPPTAAFLPGSIFVATTVTLGCLGDTPTCPNHPLYSSADALASQFGNLNAYTPKAEFVDFACAMAGDTRFVDNLGAFTGPVLAFEAGRGVGAEARSTLKLLGTPPSKIQEHVYPDLGHVDPVTLPLPNRAEQLDNPIINWLATAFN
jgi:pimeloyl-ACP methyl ester carboxylesterase